MRMPGFTAEEALHPARTVFRGRTVNAPRDAIVLQHDIGGPGGFSCGPCVYVLGRGSSQWCCFYPYGPCGYYPC